MAGQGSGGLCLQSLRFRCRGRRMHISGHSGLCLSQKTYTPGYAHNGVKSLTQLPVSVTVVVPYRAQKCDHKPFGSSNSLSRSVGSCKGWVGCISRYGVQGRYTVILLSDVSVCLEQLFPSLEYFCTMASTINLKPELVLLISHNPRLERKHPRKSWLTSGQSKHWRWITSALFPWLCGPAMGCSQAVVMVC